MSETVVLNYDRGTVKSDLSQLAEIARKAGVEAVSDVADRIVVNAKGLCPTRTGSLQQSIRKECVGNSVRVRAGGYVTNPLTGKIVDYAVFVEAKTGFMKLSLDAERDRLLDLVRQRVAEKLRLRYE